MKVELSNGNLIITIPFSNEGKKSGSGKSLVHASTGGNKPTEVSVNGKPLILGLNAYTDIK